MIAYFTRHPTASNLLMIGIMLLGLSALPNIKRETMPEFSASKLRVSVLYPGASTDETELALCIPLEDAVDGLNDIEEISCEAREGIANLNVEMAEGGNINRLLADVKTEIDAIDNFPEQAETPIITEVGREEQLITLSISADIADFALNAYAEQMKDKLQRLPGISIIDIEGFSDHQLRVELSLSLLRQYGLSTQDISNKIQRQNIKLPSGNLETRGKNLLIRFDQQQVTAATLANLVVASTPDGSQIRLSDLGTVAERFEKDEAQVFVNGQRAALLKIKKTKAQDALDLVATVREFVEQERTRVPDGVELVLSQDTAQIVKDRLNMLLSNAWQGILLVFVVMWLFFAWRYSFWVSMGLPVSFLGAFWIMAQIGVSINMISMVALLMAIGILMDDAIVIAESIASQVEKGKSAVNAAIEGVKRVGGGVFSSFLTTASVFTGLAFISGDIGAVMRVFPQVLLATIVVSLVEAFFILPAHLYHSLSHPDDGKNARGSRFKHRFNQKFEHFRQHTLVRGVETLVHYRYLTTGAVIGFFLLSMALLAGGLLKFKAFPDLEGDVLEMRILLPQGTPLEKTQSLVSYGIGKLQQLNREYTPQQPNEQALVQTITAEYNLHADAFEEGSHLATVRADLLTAEQRNTSLLVLKERWRKAVGDVPGVVSVSFKEPSFGPAGRAIEIRLHSNDLVLLSRTASEVKSALNQYQGVSNVLDDFRPGKEEWKVELLPGAMAFGVDGATIANQLRSAFFGETADEFQRQNDTLELDVRLSKADKASLWQLEHFPITLSDGTQLPLSAVARLIPQRGYARVNRVDGQRTVTIIGDVDGKITTSGSVIGELERTLLNPLLEKHPDLSVSYQGELKEGAQTGKSIMQKFLFGMLGVFIILSFQFRSYFEPVMVMLAIPLALAGALWGHLLLGYDFTIPSMIGFVSLAGIVVNDSILLVTYIKEHQRQGMSLHHSAVMASKERFRAVFITSATTIAGTFPLLLETSLQAQIVQPLVVSLMFGIAASTCLILFVLPCLYMILEDFSLTSKHHLQDA